MSTSLPDLRAFLKLLRRERQLQEINAEVDPKLELAEIHRRVIAEGGPALLFNRVRGSAFPVVTNLFGTLKRVQWAFGDAGKQFVADAATLPHELLPPTVGKLWSKRAFFQRALRAGTTTVKAAPVLESTQSPVNLESLPIITSWPRDGGPFLTLPLVYTEHPTLGVHNLGIYRMHLYDSSTTGMHMQIGKGGGFHLAAAAELRRPLPVNVFLGGPPAVLLSAIAPLPENVPELILASVVHGKKIRLAASPSGPLPLLAEAEFALIGSVDPAERFPEGPFGDHYGYYSLQHDFPVFRCQAVYHRKDAIYPATVVGKPRQEDFYIGEYLQELLSPLFPVVMPSVKKLWSYGETGFHSLAAAVVRERYKRESMMSAFRILGEGQLSLTKFLLLLDKEIELRDFRSVLTYVLERADFSSDLYIFSNLSMDTLDYAGPRLNEGSKGVLIGMGAPKRTLPTDFTATLPHTLSKAAVFVPGCLVVSGRTFAQSPHLAREIAEDMTFARWPLIILCDNTEFTAGNSADFLWSVFTRFEPAADIYSRTGITNTVKLARYHPQLEPPIVIDARMKPSYPEEVECDPQTRALVDARWREYFR